MKVIEVVHNNIEYELRLLEEAGVVQVMKAGIHLYTIRVDHQPFICDCPGGKYHKKCWHIDGDLSAGYTGIDEFEMVPSLTEPWCQWAEEAGRMSYGR